MRFGTSAVSVNIMMESTSGWIAGGSLSSGKGKTRSTITSIIYFSENSMNASGSTILPSSDDTLITFYQFPFSGRSLEDISSVCTLGYPDQTAGSA